MSKVDEELTRRFQGAERPVEVDGLFDGLERRRARRERVRRVQIAALAVVVLLVTAAGFVALRGAFQPPSREPAGDATLSPPNGLIVFSRVGDDGHSHLFAADPDGTGVEQLTHGETDDTDPAISPDGRWITFARSAGGPHPDIVTISFDQPDAVPVEPRGSTGVASPDAVWSADGSMFVFREPGEGNPPRMALLTSAIEGDGSWPFFSAPGGDLAHPSWSPGSRFVFAILGPEGQRATGWDLATVSFDGTGFRPLLTGPGDQIAPAWSPDGSRIAFIHAGQEGQEIRTVAADTSDLQTLAIHPDANLEPDLAWAPNGSSLLVSDGDWIYRVDVSHESDPRSNLRQLVRGSTPAWQPIPYPTQPAASPEARPAGEAVSLGGEVYLCNAQKLARIDWYGDGTAGAAWTGTPGSPTQGCSSGSGQRYMVFVDLDGDGRQDGGTGYLATCLFCRPYATADFNGDGVLELVVLEEASSTPTYSLYGVGVPGSAIPTLYPVVALPPGAPAMGLDRTKPARLTLGGDEGFSGSIECDDTGGRTVLRYTWVRGAVDANTDLDVDVTWLRVSEDNREPFNDGRLAMSIERTDSFGVPRDPEPTGLISRRPACGVDWTP
jgi:Tol biopolymer transport system component